MTYPDAGHHPPGESDIECSQCGAVFYMDLNRCPQCGHAVYPEDEEASPLVAEGEADPVETWLEMLQPAAAVFSGLFIAFLTATIAFIGFRFLLGEAAFSGAGRWLLLLAAPIGAIAGGYLAAALYNARPGRMGWAVGSLSILAAVVLAGVDRDVSGTQLISMETAVLWIATLLAGRAGGELWRRQQRDVVQRKLFPNLPDEDTLYQQLLGMSGHDPERVERLVEYERQFMPNATRRTLLESAVERLQRDNR